MGEISKLRKLRRFEAVDLALLMAVVAETADEVVADALVAPPREPLAEPRAQRVIRRFPADALRHPRQQALAANER